MPRWKIITNKEQSPGDALFVQEQGGSYNYLQVDSFVKFNDYTIEGRKIDASRITFMGDAGSADANILGMYPYNTPTLGSDWKVFAIKVSTTLFFTLATTLPKGNYGRIEFRSGLYSMFPDWILWKNNIYSYEFADLRIET